MLGAGGWEGLPLSVKEDFQLEENADFSEKPKDFFVEVSFSDKYSACTFLFQLLTLLKRYRWNGIDVDIAS